MKFYVYILKSLKDKGYYVGLTANIEKRLEYHNNGKVRFTKSRRPFQVIHQEEFQTRVAAREREKYFKSYKGAKEKLTIIKNCRVV